MVAENDGGKMGAAPDIPLGARAQNQLQGRGYPGLPGAAPAPRRALLYSREGCLAASPSAAITQPGSAGPARPPPTRPRAPRPPPARPRRPSGPRPSLLSVSPWPGTASAGPQTASKNFARWRREVGQAETATHGRGSAGPPPPPEPQLQPAPAPPGPAPSAPSQARAVVAPRLPG